MPKRTLVQFLRDYAHTVRKTMWLYLINWNLERYLKASCRAKRLFRLSDALILRYDELFGENLKKSGNKE